MVIFINKPISLCSMPRGNKRSRTFRRVFVKTPTKVKIDYKKRKPSKKLCPSCGSVLKGAPITRTYKTKIAKTKKRPERAFGGCLCSKCSRREIIKRNR
jgi:large subunit ribosomal protein L34e